MNKKGSEGSKKRCVTIYMNAEEYAFVSEESRAQFRSISNFIRGKLFGYGRQEANDDKKVPKK